MPNLPGMVALNSRTEAPISISVSFFFHFMLIDDFCHFHEVKKFEENWNLGLRSGI